MNSPSKLAARFGIILALIVVAYYLDATISLAMPIRMVPVTVIVMLSICQLFDYKTAIFTTTMMGVCSLIFAFIHQNFTSDIFQKPWVSVAPRIFIGVVSYAVYMLMNKLLAKKESEFVNTYIPSSVAALFGVLTNTVLVISMISLTNEVDFLAKLYNTIIALNFPVEVACAVLIVPVVVAAVKPRIARIRQERG